MKLEVLIGMIGSGKSTYARKRADEGAMILCHDDLTESFHGRYTYKQELKKVYRQAQEGILWAFLTAGLDVIIDRTHLTRESRHQWIDFVNRYISLNTFEDREPPRPKVVAIVFPVWHPCIHAQRRYAADPRGRPYDDWRKVAEHHHQQATSEPLSKDEGFDEIIYENP